MNHPVGKFRETHAILLVAFAVAATFNPAPALAIPVPSNCQIDPGGANDRPGQRDVNRFCVDSGDAPYDLYALMNGDEISVSGNNTVDMCMLFNLDGDAFADLATCITLKSSGSANGNLLELADVRLFTCDDTRADRCTGSSLVAAPYQTLCEVSKQSTDPFSPAAIDGPGSEYPDDTAIVCAVSLDDFGFWGAQATLLDTCSYPSAVVNSDPDDCILYNACDNDGDCDDTNGCTIDSCDSTGVCRHTPAGPIGCSDGLFCTGDETCNELGFCGASEEGRDCDDGVACTIDDCDEMLDVCIHDPRNTLCDNSQFCDGVEVCDADSGCTSGAAPNCDDGVSCTVDACEEVGDVCTHAPDDIACDDGLFCNGPSTCDASEGCIAQAEPDCDDGVSCTADACDETTESCVSVPSDASCSNGLFCDGDETCTPEGCVDGTPPDCNDEVACTSDTCNEEADVCMNVPGHASCSNGVFCDGTEICDPNSGCVNGDAPCPGPSVCNEASDACGECLTDAECDDGVYCNGEETCNLADNTCESGSVVDCDDDVSCTMDACDEIEAACRHTASSGLCDDGAFCDGAETCNPMTGCVEAASLPCNDGVECTADSCDEDASTCSHVPTDSVCDDGTFCNGAETCSPSLGCVASLPVACAPDDDECAMASCNEGLDACSTDRSGCICGDGEITGDEECESPRVAGTFEDCNNHIDDDNDDTTDCDDVDCAPDSLRGVVCDETCKLDELCVPVEKDPATIRFRYGVDPDRLWLHGRFAIDSEPDPLADALEFDLSNGVQTIYRARLEPGDLRGRAGGARYSFADRDARDSGNQSSRNGLSRVGVSFKDVAGVRYLVFRIRAYGDFSTADRQVMTSQIAVGSAIGSLTTAWTAAPRKWILHQRDY